MNTIPHYCQNCGANNQLGERECRKCGTRLMLVIFPPSIRHDEGIIPSYYEDHLLERVTLLEIRLSQVAERLALALDLVLQQTKNSHSDHLLLETLIDSLNTLGAVEKNGLKQKLQKKIKSEESKESGDRSEKVLNKILSIKNCQNPELFGRLIQEGFRLLKFNEETQALRTFEQASALFPQNIPLLLLIVETLFRADKFEESQKYLEKALIIEPENESFKIALSLVLADNLEIQKAQEILENIKINGSASICYYFILGLIASLKEEWKQALGLFKKCNEELDIPETIYLVGCAYFQLKKFKKAVSFFQLAVERDTNFADAWFMLAVVYQLLGEETKSYQSLELAWTSKETSADCFRFMKHGKLMEVSQALPFSRLKDLKKNLIMGNSRRINKIIRRELSQLLDI